MSQELIARLRRDAADLDNGGEFFADEVSSTYLIAANALEALTRIPSTPTEEMIEAGRAEAFNQEHRTYGDMCVAIYKAMCAADTRTK